MVGRGRGREVRVRRKEGKWWVREVGVGRKEGRRGKVQKRMKRKN